MKKVITKEEIQELIKRKKMLKESKNKKPNRKRRPLMIDKERMIKEDGRKKRAAKKEYKIEHKSEFENLKVSIELKSILEKKISEYKTSLEREFKEVFEKEVQKMLKEERRYSVQYKELQISAIAKIGLRNLGKDGWRFAFENGNKIVFWKEIKKGVKNG